MKYIQKAWQELASTSDDSMRRGLEQQQIMLNIEGWKFWLLTLKSYTIHHHGHKASKYSFSSLFPRLNSQLPLESCRMGLKMVVERGGDTVGPQLNKASEGCPWTNAGS